jgi:hypothetical protein
MAHDYLVVQLGGSSLEFYASAYSTERKAKAAIAHHIRSTYDAIGPYPIPRLNDPELGLILTALEETCREIVRRQ